MELQIAIDGLDVQEADELVGKIHEYVDIVEVGTPMIIRFGLEPVRLLSEKYPDVKVLADTKIMDGGYWEAKFAFEAGAQIATVCSVAPKETIEGAIKAANEYGKETLVDLINTKEDEFEDKVRYLDDAGAHYICVHISADARSEGSQKNTQAIDEVLKLAKLVNKAKVAVAGGINFDTIEGIKSANPDDIIVGGGITMAKDPVDACKKMYETIHSEEQ